MINKIGHISDSRNKQLKNHKYEVANAKNSLQYRVARDIREQNNTVNYNFNNDDFNKGIEWFNSGLSLEEAPDELRKNASFIDGFKKGQRMQMISEKLYNLGREYFDEEKSIPDNYKDNEFFMNGYNDALNERSK